ncbi:TrmH family RNA methyltransferase [Propionibacteriaceae bacterium G57]|uniref:TrmH family RNA methyltransferase n=1 Tax=Aestuariimicrobium sp. G57 TaxID=3418485 RepID=UPI003DA777D7
MATLIEITDPSDPRLADYVRLRETTLRHSLESQHGMFIAEGTKVIERALQAGFRPRSLLLAPRWWDGLSALVEPFDVPVYLMDEHTAERVTGFHVHRGALGSFHRVAPTGLEALLESAAQRLVLVQDIVDHTNLGAIIRCAAGLGWDGVVLSPRAADPLYRRSIKTAMGTVFQLPWARMADDDELALLRREGWVTVALALTEDAVPLASVPPLVAGGKVAIMLGTEGHGLDQNWLAAADIVATIPMQAGVDSLNVSAAAAIACYVLGAGA